MGKNLSESSSHGNITPGFLWFMWNFPVIFRNVALFSGCVVKMKLGTIWTKRLCSLNWSHRKGWLWKKQRSPWRDHTWHRRHPFVFWFDIFRHRFFGDEMDKKWMKCGWNGWKMNEVWMKWMKWMKFDVIPINYNYSWTGRWSSLDQIPAIFGTSRLTTQPINPLHGTHLPAGGWQVFPKQFGEAALSNPTSVHFVHHS